MKSELFSFRNKELADDLTEGFVSKWDKSAGEIKDICKDHGVVFDKGNL